MEEVKTYVVGGILGLITFLSRWWFSQINKKVEILEEDVQELKTEIKLNTQRDADFREHISEILTELKSDVKELLQR